MKVGAHPLVVAVALGLLNPMALAEEVARGRARGEPRAPCAGCPALPDDADDADALDADDLAAALEAMQR